MTSGVPILGQNESHQLTSDDLTFFLQHRDARRADNKISHCQRRDQKRSMKRSPDIITGLFNEGATCYLNSVLQCLLQCSHFSKPIILLQENDIFRSQSSIVHNLQHLFARMLDTNQHSVRTEELLRSFGWSKDEIYQQHDAHELFSLLMCAVEESAAPDIRLALESFQGMEQTTLTCPDCHQAQNTTNSYNCLSLEVPINSQSNIVHIQDLLFRLTVEEILDEDNQWKCSQCKQKVRATKQLTHLSSQIPQHLCVQLKRFSFDRATFRRLKVSTPVAISPALNVPFYNASNCTNEEYELTGIVCHFGIALGGHYRSLVRCETSDQSFQWFECDDELVSPIDEKELFQALTDAEKTFSTSIDAKDERAKHRLAMIMENAYLLFYSRRNNFQHSSSELTTSLPSFVRTKIEEENNLFLQTLRVETIREKLVELSVIFPEDQHERILFPKDISVGKLRDVLVRYWHASHEYPHSLDFLLQRLDIIRIRRILFPHLTKLSTSKGNEESFLGRGDISLAALKIHDTETFSLDIRDPGVDPEFKEYHPNDLVLEVQIWNHSALDNNNSKFDREAGWTNLTIPAIYSPSDWNKDVSGELQDQPTMYDLHRTILKQFPMLSQSSYYLSSFPPTNGTPLSSVRRRLPSSVDNGGCHFLHHGFFNGAIEEGAKNVLLRGSSESLSNATETAEHEQMEEKHSFLQHNDRVVIVTVPSKFSVGDEDELLQRLEGLRSKVTIFFNCPMNQDSSNHRNDSYDYHLDVSVDETLSSLRLRISQYFESLGLLSPETYTTFHFRKTFNGFQYKDEQKSLKECDISHHGVLHLQSGKGCNIGEVSLRLEVLQNSNDSSSNSNESTGFEDTEQSAKDTAVDVSKKAKYQSPFLFLCDVIVRETATVLQVKEQLFSAWSTYLEQAVKTTELSQVLIPRDMHHLRLKDLAKQPPVTLRDDRVMQRCLLNLADGRRLGVQVLPFPEVLTAEDMLITVKIASYDKKRLISVDNSIAVTRSWHVGQLYRHLMTVFPQLCEQESPPEVSRSPTQSAKQARKLRRRLRQHDDSRSGTDSSSSSNSEAENSDDDDSDGPCIPDSQLLEDGGEGNDIFPRNEGELMFDIAKVFSTGPPLTLKSALKLKWNECFAFEPNANADSWQNIDKPPLTLRDGSILVLRGRADFSRAQARVRANKEQDILVAEKDESMTPVASTSENQSSPIVAGKGLSAVRARKAREASQIAVSKPWLSRTSGAAVSTIKKSLPSTSSAIMAHKNASASSLKSQRKEPQMHIGSRESSTSRESHTQDVGEIENVVFSKNLVITRDDASMLSNMEAVVEGQEQQQQSVEESDDVPATVHQPTDAIRVPVHKTKVPHHPVVVMKTRSKLSLLTDEPPTCPATAPPLSEEQSRPPPAV